MCMDFTGLPFRKRSKSLQETVTESWLSEVSGFISGRVARHGKEGEITS